MQWAKIQFILDNGAPQKVTEEFAGGTKRQVLHTSSCLRIGRQTNSATGI